MTNGERARAGGRGRAEEMVGEVLKAGPHGARIETTTLPDGRQAVIVVAVVPRGHREAMARAFQTAYQCATGQEGEDAEE